MKKRKLSKEQRLANYLTQCRYYCSNCGHSVIIPAFVEKNCCDHCGTYIFKNKKDEFMYKLNIQLKKGNYETSNKAINK